MPDTQTIQRQKTGRGGSACVSGDALKRPSVPSSYKRIFLTQGQVTREYFKEFAHPNFPSRQEAGHSTGRTNDKEIECAPILLFNPKSPMRAACIVGSTLQVFYDTDTAVVKEKVCAI